MPRATRERSLSRDLPYLDAGGVPVGALAGFLSGFGFSGYVVSFERCADRSVFAGRSQAARPNVNSAVNAMRVARFTAGLLAVEENYNPVVRVSCQSQPNPEGSAVYAAK